jgi:hypothetical protein
MTTFVCCIYIMFENLSDIDFRDMLLLYSFSPLDFSPAYIEDNFSTGFRKVNYIFNNYLHTWTACYRKHENL